MKRRECLKRIIYIPAAASGGFFINSPEAGKHLQNPHGTPAPQDEFAFLTPPVIQWTAEDSFEVLAITSHRAACTLRFREKGSGGSFNVVTNQQHGLAEANETFHRITVSGLSPRKNYEYLIQAREIKKFDPYKVTFGEMIESSLYTVTLPGSDDYELRFMVLNDLHKNIPLIQSLMGKIEKSSFDPQFVMLNGDILSHIEGEEDVADILNLPGRYASEHPLIWIRGNHECRGDFARYMARYLTMPDGRFYYTFRRGPVQFLVLDNGEDKNDSDPEYSGLADFETFRLREEEWFTGVIESQEWKSAPFRVLVSHIPVGHIPGDEGRNRKFFPAYKQRWGAIMNRAGLDLEIAGHYHKYYLEEPSELRSFPVVIGGGPSEDSAVIISVHATEKRLALEVTNLRDEKIGQRSWSIK